MKKLIVNGVVGLFLFGGALIGGLAATGRLNHDGVANIPLLNSFFPAPPADENGDGKGAHGAVENGATDAHAAPAGEAKNADHSGEAGKPADAALSDGEQGPQGPRKTKVGMSIDNPAPPPSDGGHGGGDGEGAAKGADSHAADTGRGARPNKPNAATDGHQNTADTQHDAERDFKAREIALAQEKTNKYSPGGYFSFPGMPAGLTPDQLNEAWQRVQGVVADLEKRSVAFELLEKGLLQREDDISKRQLALGKLREEITNLQRALDDRIAKFQDQVKLVRNDEIEGLRRNAKTFESFEPQKAAELIK